MDEKVAANSSCTNKTTAITRQVIMATSLHQRKSKTRASRTEREHQEEQLDLEASATSCYLKRQVVYTSRHEERNDASNRFTMNQEASTSVEKRYAKQCNRHENSSLAAASLSTTTAGKAREGIDSKSGAACYSSTTSNGILLNNKATETKKTNTSTGFRIAIVTAYVWAWVCLYLLVHHDEDNFRSRPLSPSPTIINDTDFTDESRRQTMDDNVAASSIESNRMNFTSPSIDPANHVICVEIIKVIVSVGLFVRQFCLKDLVTFFKSSTLKTVLLQNLPVAILYAIYNNLMFVNLKNNHPIVYLIISSSRLLMTSIVWQMYFKVDIPRNKKISLILITLGVMSRNFSSEGNTLSGDDATPNETGLGSTYSSAALIVFQMMCSVMASVCNEHVLKDEATSEHLQNIGLYINSICINMVISAASFLTNKNNLRDIFSEQWSPSSPVASSKSIAIIIVLAAAGIMSSLVLRYENSITKGVASASETIIVTMIQCVWYKDVLSLSEIIGVFLATVGTLLYSLPGASRSLHPREYYIKCSFKQLFVYGFVLTWMVSIMINLAIVIGSDTTAALEYNDLYRPTIVTNTMMQVSDDITVSSLNASLNKARATLLSPAPVDHNHQQREICSTSASSRRRQKHVSRRRYKSVISGERVMEYIIMELEKVNAPLSIMFGSMLHEYRNGTGSCVEMNMFDKDFDIAVFPQHFDLILNMTDVLLEKYGWKIQTLRMERLFLQLSPTDDNYVNRKKGNMHLFEIDIYGFECNVEKGIVYFPWDNVSVDLNAFLPLKEHKTIFSTAVDNHTEFPGYYHMPFDVPCLLANMYGEDYMTPRAKPKDGLHFITKNEAKKKKVLCPQKNLTPHEKRELERQLSFCSSGSSIVPQSSSRASDSLRRLNDQTTTQNSEDQNYKKTFRSKFDISSPSKSNVPGLIACISSREQVAHALALAASIDKMNQNAGTTSVMLELYHNVSLSHYLIGKLETNKGVSTISLSSTSSCLVDAMMVTSLKDIVLVDTSVVILTGQYLHSDYRTRYMQEVVDICHDNNKHDLHNDHGSGTVISTTSKLDISLDSLQNLSLGDNNALSRKFCRLYFHRQDRISTKNNETFVFMKPSIGDDSGSAISTISYGAAGLERADTLKETLMYAFMYQIRSDRDWIAHAIDLPLYCAKTSQLSSSSMDDYACHDDITSQIKQWWSTYLDSYRILLKDRPLSWVAFDGGVAPNSGSNICSSFNTVKGARNSLRGAAGGVSSKRIALNIDLFMTSDGESIAMHSHSAFGPLDHEENTLPNSIDVSSMNLTEAIAKLRNPCVPKNAILTWLDNNQYRVDQSFNYTCHNNNCFDPINTVQDFLDMIIEDDVEIIFDLKSYRDKAQLHQAQHILSLLEQKTAADRGSHKLFEKVAVRYFETDSASNVFLAVMPNFVHSSVKSGNFAYNLRTYFNAPSNEACALLGKWAYQHNVQLAGCFVIHDDDTILNSWNKVSGLLQVSNINRPAENIKMICDVPRKQIHPDVNLWRQGLSSCVESGYTWVHHPFPVSSEADHSMPPSLEFLSNSPINSIIESHLSIKMMRMVAKAKTDNDKKMAFAPWKDYVSYWGITSPYSWKPTRQQWTFVGSEQVHKPPRTGKEDTAVFRCVSKLLTVMLFLRLQEVNVLSIDDLIRDLPFNVTWKDVFSNTAGTNGKRVRNEFVYSNSLWSHVPSAIHNATGLSFEEAVKYYIIDPIGLGGSFDTNISFPPYPARGFVGTLEDLQLIACTLASGGTSPKTRLQVISDSSVNTILKDWTKEFNLTSSFQENVTVRSMKRFQDVNSTFSHGIVSGYGLGLWHVKGWRMKGGITPVNGWLAMGSSEVVTYFDTDGIVVSMLAPQRILGLELTAPLAHVVRSVGMAMEASFRK